MTGTGWYRILKVEETYSNPPQTTVSTMKFSSLQVEHRLITLVALGVTLGFLLSFAWVF